MERKNTDNMQKELMGSSNLSSFLSDNQEHFRTESVPEILNRLFEKRELSKAALAKQSGMSEIYLHQIFAGRRNPTRSRLICLCYGLNATLGETQELLKLCGLAQLYPKIKRDSIIMYGIAHGVSLIEEDEETPFETAAVTVKRNSTSDPASQTFSRFSYEVF